jgi:hypothetical protein
MLVDYSYQKYESNYLLTFQINGPVEGLLALAACQLIAFIYGQQIYFETFASFIHVVLGSNASTLVTTYLPAFVSQAPLWTVCTNVLLTFSVLTMFLSLFLVNRAVTKKNKTLFSALPPLAPFILVLLGFILWTTTTTIFADHTFKFLFTAGVSIAYFCNRVTLAFILDLPIADTLKNPMVISFTALFANILTGYFTNG